MEVNCVLLLIYTFKLHLNMIFMPFYSNDSIAQVTHFSSTLIFRLDILTKLPQKNLFYACLSKFSKSERMGNNIFN